MEAGCENLEWRTESGKCIVITLWMSTDVLLESEITIDCAPSEMRWYLLLFGGIGLPLNYSLHLRVFTKISLDTALDHFVYY